MTMGTARSMKIPELMKEPPVVSTLSGSCDITRAVSPLLNTSLEVAVSSSVSLMNTPTTLTDRILIKPIVADNASPMSRYSADSCTSRHTKMKKNDFTRKVISS